MDAPTSSPADWRSRYGFDQPMNQAQQAYWSLNSKNGNLGVQGVNQMPFVLDPAKLFGLDPAQNKANLYSQQQGGQGQMQGQGMQGPGMQGLGMPQGDPLSQILGMVQSNPQIMPLLLQRLQGGAQTPAEAPPSGGGAYGGG